MWLKSIGIVIATSMLLAAPLSKSAMAQKGGRGGDGGGRSGWSGGGGGGGGDHDNRGDRGSRPSSSMSRSSSGSRDRDNSGSHQSFYRGSDSNRSNGDRDNDRGSRDRDSDRSRNQFSDRDRNRDSHDRDRDFSDRSRRDYGGFDRRNLPFRYGWWDTYGLTGYPNYAPWRYSRWRDRPNYWWGWSSPRGLTDYLVYGFNRPAYWSYGRGRNIYYDGDYVYYDGRRTMPADEYYRYLDDLARDVPKIDDSTAENMDWKPLGVFAVRRENESESNRTLQLAVNRDGVIMGTFFDQSKKEARPVAGRVDERTQRATWRFTDSKNGDDVVFETSIYNLTKPSANLMVHFGPKASDAEVWQLVRLEQPDSDMSAQTSQQ